MISSEMESEIRMVMLLAAELGTVRVTASVIELALQWEFALESSLVML